MPSASRTIDSGSELNPDPKLLRYVPDVSYLLMAFAWKFLLPLALVNIFSAAIWVTIMLWGSDPKWTANLSIFGISLLGWLETLPIWGRQLVALAVTLLINLVAFRQVLLLNRRPRDETPAELAQDQAFGAALLP